MNVLIDFETVSKAYPKEIGEDSVVALDKVSFSVLKGEVLGLIGANGAGKSTSIKLLMDFIRPDSGVIQIFSRSPIIPDIRKKIGYLPEVTLFPANISTHDLLRFVGKSCNIPKSKVMERSFELLTLLELWEVRKRPLRNYSKGMQQRANFAVALLNDPDILILDEPMSGLDPMGRKKIIDLIHRLKDEGKTILFCSHILEDVDRIVDNVLLLHKGRKLFFGSPSDLTAQEQEKSLAEAFVSRIRREENHG